MELIKDFIENEDGLGTIEIVVITAVLLSVALLFKNTIETFARNIMAEVFDSSKYSGSIDTAGVGQ